MAVVKYCEGCKYEGRSMGAHPCVGCTFGSRYEAPAVEERKTCGTCKHENLPGFVEPCRNCGSDCNRWESKENKSCDNCKYRNKSVTQMPCSVCTSENMWAARTKDGKDAQVITVDERFSFKDVNSMYPPPHVNFADLVLKHIEEHQRRNATSYCINDIKSTERIYEDMNNYAYGARRPYITNVIFNDPATIVFWSDHTKTVVKCQDGDIFDAEKGLAMAISKKYFGNRGHYCEEFKKWLPEEQQTDDFGKIAMKMTRTQVFPTEIIKEIVDGIRFGGEKEK